MDYSFNADIAKVYGVDEAVFIHNLYWWIAKNEANGRHYYDGKNWTYNSIEAFSQLFPFWSPKQLRRIIIKLRDNGALHIGNYNQSTYDRTQWYALDETVISIYLNGNIHLPKQSNGFAQTVTPIPDSKPDINTDSKPDRGNAPAKATFGEFGKVQLSDDEYSKLVQRLGKDSSAYIERLDGYIASKGTSYKSHYATILNWWRKDSGERKPTTKNIFLQMQQESDDECEGDP